MRYLMCLKLADMRRFERLGDLNDWTISTFGICKGCSNVCLPIYITPSGLSRPIVDVAFKDI